MHCPCGTQYGALSWARNLLLTMLLLLMLLLLLLLGIVLLCVPIPDTSLMGLCAPSPLPYSSSASRQSIEGPPAFLQASLQCRGVTGRPT